MKHTLLTALLFAGVLTHLGCSKDEAQPGVTPGTADSSINPAVDSGVTDSGVMVTDTIVLGAQIDRMGRPAVNTALNKAFTTADVAVKNAAKDAYNAAAPSTWASYKAEIKANLAVLDSLDTVCGNQLAADQTANNRYDFLAGVLADDQLYVNTQGTTCNSYLAVEANALGATNTDCGGRTPNYDVIDVTYTVLATGGSSAVPDKVNADESTHSTTVFPWLAP